MSGVETVVGLVLGVLPLLVSTAEHYNDVFRPFRRYKRFSKELKKFEQEFLGHKTVFHNECLLLLSTFTGVEKASEMLQDPYHTLRQDLDLNRKISEQLGTSREACYATIGLIKEELDSINRESLKFKAATAEEIPPGSSKYKAWKERVGTKLKFCISENRLDQRLNRLKNYNRLFGRLSAQTKEMNACHNDPVTTLPSPRSNQHLKECTLVRDAATHLYNALVDACASHPEHLAHFRLNPHHEVEFSPQRIRFEVAFAQNLLEGPSHDTDPVWFAIESMFNETITKESNVRPEEAKEAWSAFKNTLKRVISQDLSPAASSKKLKHDKSVTFASPTPKFKSCSMVVPPTLPQEISPARLSDESLPNFCIGRDFCSHVRRYSKRALSTSNTCIGYLQRTETYSHRVYYKQPHEALETNAVVTLAQIFSSISAVGSNPSHPTRMLQCESLRLARQLASAVLQFHATPILKETWRSEDVVFFGHNSISILKPEHPDMKMPHLNVRVRTPTSKQGADKTTNAMSNTNPYTFGLGIILLELAYQTPFEDLRRLEYDSLCPHQTFPGISCPSPPPSLSSLATSSDLTISSRAISTSTDDFSIATSLSRSLSTELGVPYARMVRKCLTCDFGQGTRDLTDEGLQEAFYRDVVCELERLERAFAGLQLAC